jgi:hypothetical protein
VKVTKASLIYAIELVADQLRDGLANATAAEREYKAGDGLLPLGAYAAKAGILEARCESAEKMLRWILEQAGGR